MIRLLLSLNQILNKSFNSKDNIKKRRQAYTARYQNTNIYHGCWRNNKIQLNIGRGNRALNKQGKSISA